MKNTKTYCVTADVNFFGYCQYCASLKEAMNAVTRLKAMNASDIRINHEPVK